MKEKNWHNINEDQLYLAQVKQIHAHEPVGLIATLVNSMILAIIQWTVVPHSVILGWLSFLCVLTFIRAGLLFKYKHSLFTVSQARWWGRSFFVGITLSGMGWGSAGIFLFPGNSVPHQIFTAFVLGGMVAGAVAAFAPLRSAFFGYSIPALAPIIIHFFYISDPIHLAMGAMTTLFALLMFATARNVHRMTMTSLKLRFENQNLVEFLSHEKEKVDNINTQLQLEIIERKKAEAELKKHQEQLEQVVEERTKELKQANKELKQEIHERKQIEKALRESETKYRHLVEHANDSILIAQDNVIKFVNTAAQKFSGYSSEEIGRINFIEIIHPDDRQMVYENYTRRLKGEDVKSNYSFRIISKSDEQLWVNISSVLITWGGKPATLNILRNITEQKKLEAQLQLTQRMESVGTLAGGIAHDFNNLLMGIQGNVSLMLHDFGTGHPDYEKLKLIEQYVHSGAMLTDQLLGFARAGKYESKTSDLNQLVRKTASMFGRTRRDMEIEIKTTEQLWPVEIDQGQIEQVLLNLFINAGHAMPNGGNLIIETTNQILDNNFARTYEVPDGNYVKLMISDTGMGMDDETKQHVFDPFFTTRAMARGRGLGLAAAYGIIKNHNGIIHFDSQKDTGTTFYIYLPASKKPIVTESEIPAKIMKGTETILLVDDEEMIIDVVEKMLTRMGFHVLVARGGSEAVDIFRSNSEMIDLVILDMIMPDMDGEKTFDALRYLDPNIKVLIASGYSLEDQASDILQRESTGFIQKPFRIKDLSLKLSEVLGKC